MKKLIMPVAVLVTVIMSAGGFTWSAFAEEKPMDGSIKLSATAMREIFKQKGDDPEASSCVNIPFVDRMTFETTRLSRDLGRDYFSISLYRRNHGRFQTSVDGVVDSFYPISSVGRSNVPSYLFGIAFTSHIRSRGEIAASQ